MDMDLSMFEHLKPTNKQKEIMDVLRKEAANYANILNTLLPEGPDKSFIIRQLRTVAMWANVCVTRHSSGAPRQ